MANVNIQGTVPASPKYQQGENYVLHDPNITHNTACYKELLAVAKQSIRILDPIAFEHDATDVFEAVCRENMTIEIITVGYDQAVLKEIADDIEHILNKSIHHYTLNIFSYRRKLSKQWQNQEILLWHDRYLIVDDSEFYLVGNSLDGQQTSEKYHGIYLLDKRNDIEKVAKLYKYYHDSYNAIRGFKISRHLP